MEFIFLLPILLILTLAIFEVAFFWQDVNAIYSLNTEINANAALVDTNLMTLGSTCPAATKAESILENKAPIIAINKPTFSSTTIDGQEPFALYKYVSDTKVSTTGQPQITMWVDCRNPFENGIVTQVEFYHKTLIMKASIPRFDKPEPIVIIPSDIYIASPKLNTIRHY